MDFLHEHIPDEYIKLVHNYKERRRKKLLPTVLPTVLHPSIRAHVLEALNDMRVADLQRLVLEYLSAQDYPLTFPLFQYGITFKTLQIQGIHLERRPRAWGEGYVPPTKSEATASVRIRKLEMNAPTSAIVFKIETGVESDKAEVYLRQSMTNILPQPEFRRKIRTINIWKVFDGDWYPHKYPTKELRFFVDGHPIVGEDARCSPAVARFYDELNKTQTITTGGTTTKKKRGRKTTQPPKTIPQKYVKRDDEKSDFSHLITRVRERRPPRTPDVLSQPKKKKKKTQEEKDKRKKATKKKAEYAIHTDEEDTIQPKKRKKPKSTLLESSDDERKDKTLKQKTKRLATVYDTDTEEGNDRPRKTKKRKKANPILWESSDDERKDKKPKQTRVAALDESTEEDSDRPSKTKRKKAKTF